MSARSLIAGLCLLQPVFAFAFGLQDEPVGTKVTGTFALGNKRIHAPASDWTLIARHTWTGTTDKVRQGTNFAGVYLAEIRDGRLTRGLQAWGNVDPNLARGWRHPVDPCKQREKPLAYRNLSENVDNQFCFDVSELRGYMRASTGWRRDAQQWLADQQVKVPPTVLVVRFAKLERAFWTEVFYYFDPSQLPGNSTAERAEAAAKWAEDNSGAVRAGLATRGP
ncbi:MAG TPA: hypothetical protein VM183_02585 [Burkholderiales bacterium]|nr:hypothetical protein [Burkholderiales bacterium]